ncbi:MAG: type I-E CRISPR-associated protein Cas7/Cse4/CasC, partial [Deltaproteobacteria bacterium]|nr:type I-E CRISPR-associated protein Cas7/Cse4/CasC [Deltaproteobacteria bacterium]
SSQSLKRAMRKSEYYGNELGHPSTRTAILINQYAKDLKEQYSDRSNDIEKICLYIAALIEGKTKPADLKKYKRNDKGEIKTQVLAWNSNEKDLLKKLIISALEKSDEELIPFLKTYVKSIDVNLKQNLERDIALSGRMVTGAIDSIDASLAVAHAITTHTVDGDIDWFTAVDDLNQETGETGSAHLDTTEFSSGVFYRYASLNIRQLQENLGDINRTQVLDIASHVLHLLATVVPSAKQNAFAAFNLADFAMVSFSDQPISLANAFENPVKANREGLLIPSINAFTDYHKTICQTYNLNDDPQAYFSTKECKMENSKKCNDFSALKEWLKNDGK